MRLFVTVQDDEIVVTSDTGLVDTVVLLVAEGGRTSPEPQPLPGPGAAVSEQLWTPSANEARSVDNQCAF